MESIILQWNSLKHEIKLREQVNKLDLTLETPHLCTTLAKNTQAEAQGLYQQVIKYMQYNGELNRYINSLRLTIAPNLAIKACMWNKVYGQTDQQGINLNNLQTS